MLVERQAQKLLIMNFENLNLVELNAQEVQEVEGGHCCPACYLADFATGLWEGFWDGIHGK